MSRTTDTPQRILKYISDYEEMNGIPPTIREICDGVGVSSTGTVHRHVKRLTDQGLLIEAKPGSSRSLMVSNAVSFDFATVGEKHMCLQTNDGGSIILNCTLVNGKLEFFGPIKTSGLHAPFIKVIGCCELSDDDYYDAMAGISELTAV